MRVLRDMGRVFRIVAFGSSSTEGSGATTAAHSYPVQLGTLLATRRPEWPTDVLNRGIGGDHIVDMLARLEPDVCDVRPDLVIWQVGSNDPLRGVPLATFRAGLAQGAQRIAAVPSALLLMEPQWSPALDDADPEHAFVEAVRSFAAARGLGNVRRRELMLTWFATGVVRPADVVGPDGLHMTDLGYRLLAEVVFAAVVPYAAPGGGSTAGPGPA